MSGNVAFREINGEWELSFGPTERSTHERTAIAGVWHDTKDLDWISDLRSHHFRDPHAANGYGALLTCLRKYQRVDMLLVRETMVANGQNESFNLLFEQESRGVITYSEVRSAAALITEMEFRRRAWVVGQNLIADVQRRSLSVEEIRNKTSSAISEAFAGSDRRMGQSAKDIMLAYGDYLHRREDETKTAVEAGEPNPLQGIPTPFCNLNALTSGGPTTGQVVYLGGWPGMGKSALAVDIGLHMAAVLNCPGAVYYWTGEMGKAQMARRLAAKKRGVKIGNVRAADVFAAAEEVPGFWIDDDDELDVHGLEARLHNHKVMYPGFRVCILDYVLLMGPNDHKELSALSRKLVKIAKTMDVLVIGLQQLKTSLELRQDKRPTQSDLAECGQFQRDAGGIWMVHRPGFWAPKNDSDYMAEGTLYVRKNRDGPLGHVPLTWEAKTATYKEFIPVSKPKNGGREKREPEDPNQAPLPFPHDDVSMEERYF